MKIGIDIRCLMTPERTGVGAYTYRLLDALFAIDREHEYYLFYNAYRDVSDCIPVWDYPNVHYVRRRWPNKLFSLVQLLGILPLDRFFGVALDYLFSPNINFTRVSKRVRHILTMHDLSFAFFSQYYSWQRRLWHLVVRPKWQCCEATKILCVSESTKRDVVGHYGVDDGKVVVVYPGVLQLVTRNLELGVICERYSLPEKYILYLGTLEPRKNVLGIIEGFVKSGLRTKGYELVLAGKRGWKDKDIMERIDNTEGVRYIGYVIEEDKWSLYTHSSLFVFPSLYEGFGLPVLEAMAAGVPVITSNVSSLPEVVGHGAYLVNPMNIDEIALGMTRIIAHDTMRKRLVEQGTERASRFSWHQAATQFLTCL